jgi:hypothetical protein
MTQTTLTRPSAPLQPIDVLMNLIITVVGPMLLTAAGGDIDLATLTAIKAVNAHKPRNEADLIDIGQIVTFGLAAIEAVKLSLRPEFTPAVAMRLRANAVSLNRAAAQTRRNLQKSQPEQAQPEYTAPDMQQEETAIASLAEAQARLVELKAQARPVPAPAPAAPPSEPKPRMTQADWHKMLAQSMTTVAAEFSEDLQNLPPVERKLASLKAQVLSTTASHLISRLNPAPDQPGKYAPAKNRSTM